MRTGCRASQSGLVHAKIGVSRSGKLRVSLVGSECNQFELTIGTS